MPAKNICPECKRSCEVNFESGEFDADGPRGTITGNMGDSHLSDCCGADVINPVYDYEHDGCDDLEPELCFE